MLRLLLYWLAVLCFTNLVLAGAVPPAHPIAKPQVTELPKNAPTREIQSDGAGTFGAKAQLASERSGTLDGPVIPPISEKKPPKSKRGFAESDRNKQLDRKATEAVRDFFRQEGKQQFALDDTEKHIRVTNVIRDSDFPDRRIVTVDQFFHGVPVFGARTAVEVIPAKKDVMSVKRVSGVPSVSGRLVSQDKLIDLNTTPVVSWTEAIDRALAVYNRGRRSKDTSIANGGNCAVKVQLTVLDPTILGLKADRARLAWHILVDGIVVFIDAQDGTKIFQYNDMLSAFDHIRIYDVDGGGQDQCETATPVLDENGPYPGAPSVSADSDDNAGKAQAEAKKAHDFFKKLGWKSYDEQASVINFCVRVQQGNWDSRFGQYSPTLHCVYLYPGLALAQDIAFHEFTHGVIQFMPALKPSSTWPSGGLERRDEAGALGEALADFFGAQIEGLNWTIGEHIPDDPFFYPQELGPGKNGKPLRNMADPHKGTYTQNEECPDPSPAGFYPNCPNRGWNNGQPDHYGELVTAEQQLCAWKEPGNGCIHINSGIFNKAMFLAANGGDHHNVHVEGIGSGKLVRIIFRALRNKAITPNINMKEFARKSHEACTDLMEKSVIRNPVFTRLNIVKANCDQIQNAFAAVGLMKPHN